MNNEKYAHYGMTATAETYLGGDYHVLHAQRVLAWTNFPEDTTRFVFADPDPG